MRGKIEVMKMMDDESIRELEEQYPGFRESLDAYESADLPPCPVDLWTQVGEDVRVSSQQS